ncbi:hypothetical protein [Streptococcus marmotae]|uniref:hypothetical protein n=1 Tax=Streptococcus marmotae TaxID=1825069 RepID=UPI00082F1184|nr:hypothetical protein [Streptococcus marmotae]
MYLIKNDKGKRVTLEKFSLLRLTEPFYRNKDIKIWVSILFCSAGFYQLLASETLWTLQICICLTLFFFLILLYFYNTLYAIELKRRGYVDSSELSFEEISSDTHE